MQIVGHLIWDKLLEDEPLKANIGKDIQCLPPLGSYKTPPNMIKVKYDEFIDTDFLLQTDRSSQYTYTNQKQTSLLS